ncbi:MAG: MOSC domain-containing protein [Candidatus Neomarinimicrobiota bacterium]|nr:MOSC domain-containing protein [Candidatus Neomarinimicrobiota bacterium]
MSASVIQISVKPDTPGEVGLPKMPVDQVWVKKEGLEGDYNRARMKKGNDPDKAVMIISTDILDQLNQEGWPVKPGDVGENLTITNIDYKKIAAGQKYLIGEAEIEISFICEPCTNLYKLPYVGTQRGPEFMAAIMNRRGWYARVLKEGLVSVGNTFLLQ